MLKVPSSPRWTSLTQTVVPEGPRRSRQICDPALGLKEKQIGPASIWIQRNRVRFRSCDVFEPNHTRRCYIAHDGNMYFRTVWKADWGYDLGEERSVFNVKPLGEKFCSWTKDQERVCLWFIAGAEKQEVKTLGWSSRSMLGFWCCLIQLILNVVQSRKIKKVKASIFTGIH